jgi:drug/metabolite transporter (DMT)-like permease
MYKLLSILLVSLVLEAIGVVLLNKGLRQMGELSAYTWSEAVRVFRLGIINPYFLLGVFFEALFFGGLLILLSKSDVSFVWPLTSLGFVITTIAARFYLHEQVTGWRWFGVLLIVAGAGLVSWTEHRKESGPATPPPTRIQQN